MLKAFLEAEKFKYMQTWKRLENTHIYNIIIEVIFMFMIDLNSDLGEGFGDYTLGMDNEVLKYVSSANIACGWHAGDPIIMNATVKMAKKMKVSVGAHPGYNDLMGFGRRNMSLSFNELKMYVKYQLGALMAISEVYGVKIQHLKPHGAMYNAAATNYEYARAISEAIYEVDKNIILLGLANSEMINAGKTVGIKTANEVFADREYMDNGTLVPRKIEGSVITDADLVIKRAVKMIKNGTVESINGKIISIKADSICVHGDNPNAVDFVKKIKESFESEHIKIKNLSEIIA